MDKISESTHCLDYDAHQDMTVIEEPLIMEPMQKNTHQEGKTQT